MKLAVDVKYDNDGAAAGGVLFKKWDDQQPTKELFSQVNEVKDYEPGAFYKRELPPILKLLNDHRIQAECILIDGYVYLDGHSLPGLGAYLYHTLSEEIPIIGVAKKRYKGTSDEYELFRGKSKRPLLITVAGMSLSSAKDNIYKMHGESRIPTLLKRVDQISRGIQR
ncbi:MAG: endonuclease V [Anaerolineales bacterium]|jgi:deoxyribonuclease V